MSNCFEVCKITEHTIIEALLYGFYIVLLRYNWNIVESGVKYHKPSILFVA